MAATGLAEPAGKSGSTGYRETVVVVGQAREPPAACWSACRPLGSLPWSSCANEGETTVPAGVPAPSPADAVACWLAQRPARPFRATLSGLFGEVADEAVQARAPSTVKMSITTTEIRDITRLARTQRTSAEQSPGLSAHAHHFRPCRDFATRCWLDGISRGPHAVGPTTLGSEVDSAGRPVLPVGEPL